MCELIGDNGFTLTVGVSNNLGCVQHAPGNGTPPYLMAVGSTETKLNSGDVEFVVGGTATPIDRRYCFPFERVKQIVTYFVETGKRWPGVVWEEF